MQNIQADVGHYILSDKPMSEDEWIATRTRLEPKTIVEPKTIEAKALSSPLAENDRRSEKPRSNNGIDEAGD